MGLRKKLMSRLNPRLQEKLIGGNRFAKHELDWHLHPKSWVSRSRLRSYKNAHKGDRCFILGNGPSLKKINLPLLESEYTFGLNRVYLLFDQLGFSTTYFVAVNHLVIEQCAREIENEVPCPKFLDWKARTLLNFAENMIFLRSCPLEPRFFNNLEQGVWQGTTVTYVAMQIAFYMGFSQVILVGVDHSFVTKGPPHKIVVTRDKDHNHFDDQYFGDGFRWQLPDLEGSELAYRMAKYHYERDGREIVDATVDGKLNVFRKIKYDSLF
jgi:hypothetical protein